MKEISLAHVMLAGIVGIVVFPFLMLLISTVYERFAPGRTKFSSEKTTAKMLCNYIGETHRKTFTKKRYDKKSQSLIIPAIIIILELLAISFIIWKL